MECLGFGNRSLQTMTDRRCDGLIGIGETDARSRWIMEITGEKMFWWMREDASWCYIRDILSLRCLLL